MRGNQLESILAEKELGVPVNNKLTMSQKCAFVVKKTISLPGCIRRIVAIRSREVTFPLYLSPARHIWNAGCCSGISSTREVWTYWRGSH